MIYKKKNFILSIFIIIIIQILLIINNKQKTSFRFFIWNIENVSIGRLICISYISGLLMNSILNKKLPNDYKTHPIKEENAKISSENNYSINREDNYESVESPPERDLRDTQPTISVNYRVIKVNGENQIKDINQEQRNPQYQDDWENSESEW